MYNDVHPCRHIRPKSPEQAADLSYREHLGAAPHWQSTNGRVFFWKFDRFPEAPAIVSKPDLPGSRENSNSNVCFTDFCLKSFNQSPRLKCYRKFLDKMNLLSLSNIHKLATANMQQPSFDKSSLYHIEAQSVPAIEPRNLKTNRKKTTQKSVSKGNMGIQTSRFKEKIIQVLLQWSKSMILHQRCCVMISCCFPFWPKTWNTIHLKVMSINLNLYALICWCSIILNLHQFLRHFSPKQEESFQTLFLELQSFLPFSSCNLNLQLVFWASGHPPPDGKRPALPRGEMC